MISNTYFMLCILNPFLDYKVYIWVDYRANKAPGELMRSNCRLQSSQGAICLAHAHEAFRSSQKPPGCRTTAAVLRSAGKVSKFDNFAAIAVVFKFPVPLPLRISVQRVALAQAGERRCMVAKQTTNSMRWEKMLLPGFFMIAVTRKYTDSSASKLPRSR